VDASAKGEHIIESIVRDSAGDVVAKGTARWLVGPREDRAAAASATSADEVAHSDSARDAR
jgi:hypothetical protein